MLEQNLNISYNLDNFCWYCRICWQSYCGIYIIYVGFYTTHFLRRLPTRNIGVHNTKNISRELLTVMWTANYLYVGRTHCLKSAQRFWTKNLARFHVYSWNISNIARSEYISSFILSRNALNGGKEEGLLCTAFENGIWPDAEVNHHQ
jgi:hypothetical protein